MLIALDYDNCYTRDPDAWDAAIAVLRDFGHDFVCVTGRTQAPRTELRPIPMPTVLAGNEWKRAAAERAGYKVDVWIDDLPGMIEQVKLIGFGDEPDAISDKDRIDWLEAHPHSAQVRGGRDDGHQAVSWGLVAHSGTLREVLDVVITKEREAKV